MVETAVVFPILLIGKANLENRNPAYGGEVREWFKRQSWKDCVPEMVPRVRISPSPPCAGES